jgi:hypothetical protein
MNSKKEEEPITFLISMQASNSVALEKPLFSVLKMN